MDKRKSIILSGFADEAANDKTVDLQFSVCAALGMEYLSLRFIDVGWGIKNVIQLDQKEIEQIVHKLGEYSLRISSIGSPIGKIKLRDQADGSNNSYRPFDDYMNHEVERACEVAMAVGAPLIRGFSFYPPRNGNSQRYIDEAVLRLKRIASRCDRQGLTFGVEVEANLVGCTGTILAEIHRRVDHRALALVLDCGNLVTQGFSANEVFEQYRLMKPGLGWLHVKDYKNPTSMVRRFHVDEESLAHFVPADQGDAGHDRILADLVDFLPELNRRMQDRGSPGTFADLEPHLKKGGQFGGYSGPDGFGIALRAFCRLCQKVGIEFRLRDFANPTGRQPRQTHQD